MLADLLATAREQADRSVPAVRCAALFHIARVLTKQNHSLAERVLDEALAVTASLPDDERAILMGEGAVLAACVSPARGFEVLRSVSFGRESVLNHMLIRMSDHGFHEQVVEYLDGLSSDDEYSFGVITGAFGRWENPDLRRKLLRRAYRAIREGPAARHDFNSHHFVREFTRDWRDLPSDEARGVTRDLVEHILSQPDARVTARFRAGSAEIRFMSTHDYRLFEILEPLQVLDPELAKSLFDRYPELAAAAARFPFGHRSMTDALHAETSPPPRSPAPDAIDMDGVQVGQEFIRIRKSLETGFAEAFEVALEIYEDDRDPKHLNEVPQQCWPSAAAFRTILYKAGRYEGESAARYLDRIPDSALRLLAQIELAASLAGLPELGCRTMRSGRGGLQEMVRPRPRQPLPAGLHRARWELAPAQKPDVPASRDVQVVRATAPPDDLASGGCGADFVHIRNASLAGVIAELQETPLTRIEWPSAIDSLAKYDFALVLARPAPGGELKRLLLDGIARHFGVKMALEDRERDVWVLAAPTGIKARERRQDRHSSYSVVSTGSGGLGSRSIGSVGIDGPPRPSEAMRLQQILNFGLEPDPVAFDPDLISERMHRHMARSLAVIAGLHRSLGSLEGTLTMDELCQILEVTLDRPLVNETGLKGSYAIDVSAGSAQSGAFLKVIASELGLSLSMARRTLPTLVVE